MSIVGWRQVTGSRASLRHSLLALVLGAFCACGESAAPALTRLMEARQLTAELRVLMSRAVTAADRAVMADTDDASSAFATEARRSTATAQTHLEQLEPLLRGLAFSEETQRLATFRSAFTRLVALDEEILALAVENTNLKAQRLSFGPARAAADELQHVLAPLTHPSARSVASLESQVLALSAVASVREIEVLEAPHIAASEDAVMGKLEAQMASLHSDARGALDELARSKEAEPRSLLPSAWVALKKFEAVHGEIVNLSRRNSNVRSFALSLGEKLKLTSVCESSLSELSDQLTRRSFPATR